MQISSRSRPAGQDELGEGLQPRFEAVDRLLEPSDLVFADRLYTLEEAVEILQKCPPVKFAQSVEISIKSGIDAKKSDQQIRGTITLPHGIGKKIRVLSHPMPLKKWIRYSDR